MAEITIDYTTIRNPQLKEFLENDFKDVLFAVANGHDHDGTNSKTLSPAAVIAADSVTTVAILDANVTSPKLAASSVTTAKLADDAVTAAKIADGTIVVGLMAANSIDSDQYVDGSIDTAHFAAGAVDTTALGADCVTGANIADDQIDSEHYVAGSIDAEHIAADAVTTAKILNANVTTAKIADANVTNAKLAALARGSIKVGGATNLVTDLVAKTSGQILVGDGTDLASVAVSGDATLASTGAITIANDAVSNAKLANITRGSIKVGGVADAPTDLNAKSDGYILVGDGTDIKSVAVSGDITLSNAGAVAVGAGKITTAMLAATAAPSTKAIVAAHAAAIPVTGNGNLALTIADAAETNTLAVPTFAGQEICISADTVAGSGSRTVTVASPVNATGNNTILFNAASEFIILRGIKAGATFAWRVVAIDGATLSTVG